MAQYVWPPVSFSGNSNPSVGVNGDTLPTSSTLVGGSDGTDLRPLLVETDGTLNVVLHGTSTIAGHVVVDSGTISQLAAGTISILQAGTVSLLQAGTVSIVQSGTINQVGTVASLASGTVTLSGAPAISGTVAVSNVAAGTISSLASGTVSINTGTLSNLASGTVTLTSATIASLSSGTVTINSGTLANLATGTVTINSGTLASLATGTVTINGSPVVKAQASTPTAGTVSQAAITVGTVAVQCTVSGSAPLSTRSVLVINPDKASTGVFYVGSSNVATTSTNRGIQIIAGQSITINNDASPYYIISDTASQTVYIMETA